MDDMKGPIDDVLPSIGVKSKEHGGVWIYDPEDDKIVIRHRAIKGTTTELYRRIRDLTIGTEENPEIIECTAKLENSQDHLQQYVGMGERYPSFFYHSIFVLDHHGEPRFVTHKNGESTVTKLPSLDMTEEHTYRVEWTDEPRATLFVDDEKVGEHITNVPTKRLLRFVEIINQKDNRPKEASRLEVNASFLLNGITGPQ